MKPKPTYGQPEQPTQYDSILLGNSRGHHVKNANTSLFKPMQMVHQAAPNGNQSDMFTLMMNNTSNLFHQAAHSSTKTQPAAKVASRNAVQNFEALKNGKKKCR